MTIGHIAEIGFWTCLGLLVYTYALYAGLIWAFARLFARPLTHGRERSQELPAVTLLIAACNEAAVIEKKVLNSLDLDYPRNRLRIVVASDGSRDATAEIVLRYADRGVRLIHCPERRGKSATLNAVIAATAKEGNGEELASGQPKGDAGTSGSVGIGSRRAEILVLSDANTDYQPDAIRNLVRWFAVPQVDVVCGRLILKDAQDGRNVDGLYWRYENFLKNCEGRLGALLGANGAIYAIRRSAYVPIPNNTIIDDFVIPLLSKLQNRGRIVYDQEAVATEETAPHLGSEFRRRVRIGTGAYQSLPLLWRLLHPRHGWTAFAFLSHKLIRWLVPFFMLGMLVSNLFLLQSRLYQITFAVQLSVLAVSLIGTYLPGRGLPLKAIRTLAMFTAMNLALLVGFWRWLTAEQTGTWQRTSRDEQGNRSHAGQVEGAFPQDVPDDKCEKEMAS